MICPKCNSETIDNSGICSLCKTPLVSEKIEKEGYLHAISSIGNSIGNKISSAGSDIKDRITRKNLQEIFNNIKDSASQAVKNITDSISGFYNRLDRKKALLYLEEVYGNSKDFTSKNIDAIGAKIKSISLNDFQDIISSTWIQIKETPEKAYERFQNMDKTTKVAAVSLMAGGSVVSIPFIIALGPMSIVSALATLGMGSLAAGGYGVAGGIFVTSAGAALSGTIAGLIAGKNLNDPDVEKLIQAYTELETVIQKNYLIMEKHNEQFRKLHARYSEIAEFVAELHEKVSNNKSYDNKEIQHFIERTHIVNEDIYDKLAEISE